MKTKKILLGSMALLAFLVISAAKPVASSNEECKQCGVSNSQIIEYLKNCSHHHSSACCVVDIPGTCNSTASIENCGTATVFVTGGSIIGHSDSQGFCN